MQGRVSDSVAPSHTWVTPFLAMALIAAFFIIEHHPTVSTLEGFNSNREALVDLVDEGSTGRRVAYLMLGGIGAGLLFLSRGGQFRLGVRHVALAAYISWAGLSIGWSIDPALSLKRLATLALLTLCVVGVVRFLPLRRVWAIIVVATGSYLIAGVAAEIFLGTFRPLDAGYRFAGTLHPNGQGVNLALLTMGSLYLAWTTPRHRRKLYIVAATAVSFLLLTRSRTSLAAVLGALALLYLLKLWGERRARAALFVAALAVAASVVAFANAVYSVLPAAVAMGRDDNEVVSFTGRVPLWEELVEVGREHRLIGHGYNAFWTPDHIWTVSARSGWAVMEAHSVYVETWLSLGLPGLASLVLLFTIALGSAIRLASRGENPEAALAASIVAFAILHGLMEGHAMSGGLFTLAIFAVVLAPYPPGAHRQPFGRSVSI